jgi:hypothetical protein
MSYPKNVDLELRAPLQLPAEPGKPLTTQGGNTLDDGSGNLTLAKATVLTLLSNNAPASFSADPGGNFFYLRSNGTDSGLVEITPGSTTFWTSAAQPGATIANGHVNAVPSTPALPANPPVSGTVYQNTTGGPIIITVPITATAVGGSGQWALGSTSTPGDWGGAEQIGVSGEVHNMTLYVPNNWYWSLTATSATIGTASVLGL